MRRRLLVLATLTLALLLPAPAQAHEAQTRACNARQSANQRINDDLVKQATYVEHNTKTKAGTPVDRVYHTLIGIKADGSAVRILPAHYGGPHALYSAYSPQWNGYLYYADMAILHWLSSPCNDPDLYAFAATVACARNPGFEPTHCLFDAWVGLQVTDIFFTNWYTPWGYSHRKNASPRVSCYAEGGKHPLADNAFRVRTWLYLDGSFTAPSPDHPFNARKSTSSEMETTYEHRLRNSPCYAQGGWCDATTPPNNNPHTVFNSCNI